MNSKLTNKQKKLLDKAVKKIVSQYGKTLRMLRDE